MIPIKFETLKPPSVYACHKKVNTGTISSTCFNFKKVTTIPTWEHEKEMDGGDELHHSVTQELKSLVMRHLIMKNAI